MGWADEFAEGFAAGFVPAYESSVARREKRRAAEFESKLSAWESIREKQQEEAQKARQAQRVASAIGVPASNAVYDAMNIYGSASDVINAYQEGQITFNQTAGSPSGGADANEQTQSALTGGFSRNDVISASEGPTKEAAEAMSSVDDNAVSTSMDFLRQQEGFREEAYYDVDAYRAGFGSDRITRQDGSVIPVSEGTRVTREDAERDLERRISDEFMPSVRDAVGAEAFNRLTTGQKTALTSIAYNYGRNAWDGRLSDIANAVRTGDDEAAARGIMNLSTDNDGINASRRQREAALFSASSRQQPVDQQMEDSGMSSPLLNSENVTAPEERNAIGSLFGAYDNADSRFSNYLDETGQRQAFEQYQSGGGSSLPASNYSLSINTGSNVDLSDIVGKSASEIDQFLIANDSALTSQDRERIAAIREVAVQDEQDSNWWRSPEEISGKSSDFLRTFVALTDNEDARNQSLQALEARSRNDVPTSAKDAAFTEFWTSLPDEMSSTDRGQAAIDFENTWSSATNVGGQMDIFAELAERDSPAELTALRTVVNNDPSLADNREQFIGLIDKAISNQNAISDGGYTMDDYRGDLVQFTKDLTTGSEEERQAASEWFATEQPGIIAGLKAAQGAELDIEASSLVDAGVPEELARLAATDSLDLRPNRFGQLNVYNKNTGEIVSQAERRSGAPTGEIRDINLEIPTDEELSNLSDENRDALIEQLAAQARDERAAFEEALGGGGIETFKDTLSSIDVSAALGGPGKVQSGVNTLAALFGANAPFSENRRAANALERLQRVTALTMAQAQANQRGSVTLMNEFRANAVGPNELIGIDGALDKFKANYNIINDRVRQMREIGSGDGPYDGKEVTRANLIAEDLSKLRDYYGALVQTIEDDAPQLSGANFITGEGGNTPPPEQTEKPAPTPSGGAQRRNRRNQSQSQQQQQKSQQNAIKDARNAILQGADPAAVRDRLINNGYDASGL